MNKVNLMINHDQEVVLYYDPSVVWGDGTHDSTQACLEMMKRVGCEDKTIIDFGTGTGILSIYAKKKGASKVVGIDVSPYALEYARKNATANDVDVEFILNNYNEDFDLKADLIVTNFPPMSLKVLLPILKRNMKPSTKVIVSFPTYMNLKNELKVMGSDFKIIDEILKIEYGAYLLEEDK